MMSIGEEIMQILSVAHELSGLQAGDFEALRAVAEQVQGWAEKLESEIKALLERHETTKSHAQTYLGGKIAEWFRSLFEVHNVEQFLHKQMRIAAEHVRAGVPNEVVLALVPRWVEFFLDEAEPALGYETARRLALILIRVLNLTAIVMVATYDMLIRRTILRETGFSEALLKRLQTQRLEEIVEEMESEQKKSQQI